MTGEREVKCCTKCGISKPYSSFIKDKSKSDGLYSSCKDCNKGRRKSHYYSNREDIIRKVNEWSINNKEKSRLNKLKYSRSEKGRIKMREYKKANKHKHYPKTVEQKLKASWRKKMCKIKTTTKFDFKTFVFLGYDVGDLKRRLEFNFKPEMSWENYGKVWHIDHKKPLSYFDYSKPEEIKKSWMLCNLQPLFVKDNLMKGNRWIG